MADTEKKHRSPAYPFISLGKALWRAGQLYEKERRHPTPLAVAAKRWGYAEKSSGGLQTVSALKQYGLLEDVGGGADRRVKLTELALKIILDEVPDSAEKRAALKHAALRPKLFGEMFEKWGAELPSDETIRTFLKRDKSFNDEAVTGVIFDFKDTLAHAQLTESDKIPLGDGNQVKPREASLQETLDEKPVIGPLDGVLTLSVPYGSKGSLLSVQVRLAGERLKPAHIAKVRKYLELAESDLGSESDGVAD